MNHLYYCLVFIIFIVLGIIFDFLEIKMYRWKKKKNHSYFIKWPSPYIIFRIIREWFTPADAEALENSRKTKISTRKRGSVVFGMCFIVVIQWETDRLKIQPNTAITKRGTYFKWLLLLFYGDENFSIFQFKSNTLFSLCVVFRG